MNHLLNILNYRNERLVFQFMAVAVEFGELKKKSAFLQSRKHPVSYYTCITRDIFQISIICSLFLLKWRTKSKI